MILDGEWGTAEKIKDKVIIPQIRKTKNLSMGDILRLIYEKMNCTTMVFKNVQNPLTFKKHLKNVTAEYFKGGKYYIKIEYIL